MITMKYTALITIAALTLTFVFSGRAGAMRGKHGVNAPAMTGHAEFDTAFRIHMNTVEQLVLFIPVLWLATSVVGDIWAAGYAKAPEKRGQGMIITILSTAVLTMLSLWGVVQEFMA